MYEYFKNFNLLAEQQYGFLKKHSTDNAAIKLIDHVSKEIESGKTPGNVYIDLSKAFETLTFDILLYKLKYYEMIGTALNLMSSYLKIENSMLCMIPYDLNILKHTLVYQRGQYWVPCSSVFTLMT